MSRVKEWMIANKIWFMMIVVIAIIGYYDSLQIMSFFTINTPEAWDSYYLHTLPALLGLWTLIFALAAYVYYLFTDNRYESVGIFLSAMILLYTGLEDIFYFIFSTQDMGKCLQYLNDLHTPVAWFSTNIMHETCVSPESLVIFTVIGIFLSKIVLDKLKIKEAKK